MRRATGGGTAHPLGGPMRPRLLLVGLVVALPVLAAGCGGSDDSGSEPTAAESWAADVCSTVGSWTTTVADARSTLSAPAQLSVDEIESTFAEVRSATSTLVGELGDLSAPDTEAGDEAEKRIESLSEEMQKQADIVEEASSDQPQGVGERLTRVSTVSGAVAQMVSEAQSAIADIRALDGAKELEDAFSSTTSCQDLKDRS